MGKPSVFPTGVTKYDKSKTYNGYTLFQSAYGPTMIDMNGRLVKVWSGVNGNPVKALPNGQILATTGSVAGKPGATSSQYALQLDWDGNVVWSYHENRRVKMRDGSMQMASCHHHDFEREGTAAGYYSPASEPKLEGGNTILLTHNPVWDLKISDQELLDERIIELNAENEVIWEWNSHEHFEEFGLDEAAKKSLFANPMMGGDWIHLNAVSTLGKNHFFEEGDERFAPENLICSSRQLNVIFIIEKSTGKIIWRLGPDYLATSKMQKIGQIIGQHHAHMIPDGLPGAGNILIFDNGSFGGYGAPNGCAPKGTDVMRRHYSRVLEIDPVTFDVKLEYMKAFRNEEDVNEMNASEFFSAYISSAQRLPNGNTLITQGADGILIEINPEKEIVWEFVNPFRNRHMPPLMQSSIYRAYRVPYEWVPQLEKPDEFDVIPPENEMFRVPGSAEPGEVTAVETKVIIESGRIE